MQQRCLTWIVLIGMCCSVNTVFAGGHQEQDSGTDSLSLNSPAIENGRLLEQYRCERKENGVEKSIPLAWKNVPEGTKSLALVMYHYPHPEDTSVVNSYLLLWGIDPSVSEIPWGKANSGTWYMGRNKDGNAVSYTSPCSPSPGDHEYVITLFALAEYPKDLPKESTMDVDFQTFMNAMAKAAIIEKTELVFKDSGPKHGKIGYSEKTDNRPPPPPPENNQGNEEQSVP